MGLAMILSMIILWEIVILLSIYWNLIAFDSVSVIFIKIGLFLINLSLQQNKYLLSDRENGFLYPVTNLSVIYQILVI